MPELIAVLITIAFCSSVVIYVLHCSEDCTSAEYINKYNKSSNSSISAEELQKIYEVVENRKKETFIKLMILKKMYPFLSEEQCIQRMFIAEEIELMKQLSKGIHAFITEEEMADVVINRAKKLTSGEITAKMAERIREKIKEDLIPILGKNKAEKYIQSLADLGDEI